MRGCFISPFPHSKSYLRLRQELRIQSGKESSRKKSLRNSPRGPIILEIPRMSTPLAINQWLTLSDHTNHRINPNPPTTKIKTLRILCLRYTTIRSLRTPAQKGASTPASPQTITQSLTTLLKYKSPLCLPPNLRPLH